MNETCISNIVFLLFQIEKIIYCPMSSLQEYLHDCVLSQIASSKSKRSTLDAFPILKKMNKIRNMTINNSEMQLRKLCNHPYLMLEDIQSIPDSMYFRDVLCSSGKLAVLDKLIDMILIKQEQDGHKMLIFSQFTTMLDIVQGYLFTKGFATYRLDGRTDRNIREDIIKKFHNDENKEQQSNLMQGVDVNFDEEVKSDEQIEENVRVFLLSTRAGALWYLKLIFASSHAQALLFVQGEWE